MAELNTKDKEVRNRALYMSATYTSESGKETFKDLLLSSGVFQSIDATDPEAVPRHNIMVRMMYEMGILSDKNVDIIVDKLLSLCYKE